jgi:tetratricopeptide (TPR) repeat protein
VLGNDHPDTLNSMRGLAVSFYGQGRYIDAEALQRQTLQLLEKVLGKDHRDTLQSMSDLAVSLYAQRKYSEAEALQRQTLQLQEAVLGKDHPYALKSKGDLATTLYGQGKYSEATSCKVAHSANGCVCRQEGQNVVRRQDWQAFNFTPSSS